MLLTAETARLRKATLFKTLPASAAHCETLHGLVSSPAMPATRNKIEKNLQHIRQNIAGACLRAGRSPQEVAIVAVTKSADMESIKAAVDLGLTDLAESRAGQLAERAVELAQWLQRKRPEGPGVRWHMVGHLQRNKVKQVIEHVGTMHSVDSLRLAEEINNRAEKLGRIIDVLVEVNCSREPHKFGCAVGAAGHLAELICTLKHVRLVGLMTMAAQSTDPETSRPTFIRLRELFCDIRHERIGGEAFKHLSMGMSQDYPVAVEEGATMLRIGTALFE